jgi:hypothetical protein
VRTTRPFRLAAALLLAAACGFAAGAWLDDGSPADDFTSKSHVAEGTQPPLGADGGAERSDSAAEEEYVLDESARPVERGEIASVHASQPRVGRRPASTPARAAGSD